MLYNINMIFIPIIVFVFGLIIGSFLNVVILRLNTGRSIVSGRSKCTTCSRELQWYELVPVFSFLFLGGKCRSCKNQISFQYAFVELLTAISFAIAYIKIVIPGEFTTTSWINFIFTLIIISLSMVMLVYDLKHKIIPDKIVFPFIILAFLSVVFRFFSIETFQIGKFIVEGIVVALPFLMLWFISKGRFMGFGDVKLALGIGWLVGLASGFAVIIISFWIGGVVGLFLMSISRKYKMDSQIPFAPFLILALFLVQFWNISIQNLFPIWQ